MEEIANLISDFAGLLYPDEKQVIRGIVKHIVERPSNNANVPQTDAPQSTSCQLMLPELNPMRSGMSGCSKMYGIIKMFQFNGLCEQNSSQDASNKHESNVPLYMTFEMKMSGLFSQSSSQQRSSQQRSSQQRSSQQSLF